MIQYLNIITRPKVNCRDIDYELALRFSLRLQELAHYHSRTRVNPKDVPKMIDKIMSEGNFKLESSEALEFDRACIRAFETEIIILPLTNEQNSPVKICMNFFKFKHKLIYCIELIFGRIPQNTDRLKVIEIVPK